MRNLLLFLFFTVSFSQGLYSQSKPSQEPILLSDTAQISLLTSSAWEEAVYALYGHTAIRVCDTTRNLDIVFNYGLFDFNSSNFVFRFVKGDTNYMVGAVQYKYYIEEYRERGVGVTEQIFNLSLKEKQDILDALINNTLPENRVYLYNFFYDNCATRPRDIIEKYVHGEIEYTPTNKSQTYRDLVWECVSIQPWTQFGIDLIIGADADKIISDRQKDFLPYYLMKAYEGSKVKSADGTVRDFILKENRLLTPVESPDKDSHILPLYAGCILLVVTVLLSLVVWKKKWFALGKVFDTILFIIAGLAGCVIFFLMFFSIHPCVNPNWNIIWLNPLQLIVAFLFFVKSLSKFINCYHFINFVALLAFLLAWSLMPQQLEIAFIPFILSICMRSGMNILQLKKFKKKADYSLPKRK
ncbi:MAG: DUF4105 domain-containing protein [Prevotella sp.]|jgi:hypothetical protein|nr:DUF4105 domain-containing protein [Prevotella sp.]